MCVIIDDIIKFKNFDFDTILFDEKLYENILIYDMYWAISLEL